MVFSGPMPVWKLDAVAAAGVTPFAWGRMGADSHVELTYETTSGIMLATSDGYGIEGSWGAEQPMLAGHTLVAAKDMPWHHVILWITTLEGVAYRTLAQRGADGAPDLGTLQTEACSGLDPVPESPGSLEWIPDGRLELAWGGTPHLARSRDVGLTWTTLA